MRKAKREAAKRMPAVSERPDLYDGYDCREDRDVGEAAKAYQAKLFAGLFRKSEDNGGKVE